jgi:hypothetical protein
MTSPFAVPVPCVTFGSGDVVLNSRLKHTVRRIRVDVTDARSIRMSVEIDSDQNSIVINRDLSPVYEGLVRR